MRDENIIDAMEVLTKSDRAVAYIESKYMRRKMVAHAEIMMTDGTLFKFTYNVAKNTEDGKLQFSAVEEYDLKYRVMARSIWKSHTNCVIKDNGIERRLNEDDCENAVLAAIANNIANASPNGGFLFLNGETGNLEYKQAA